MRKRILKCFSLVVCTHNQGSDQQSGILSIERKSEYLLRKGYLSQVRSRIEFYFKYYLRKLCNQYILFDDP